jgi:precorrin-8X/cobalt-precorrin-8 methylmutase
MTEKIPFIYKLFERPVSGPEIETASFRIIDAEAPPHAFSPGEWQVVRRMIHTTGDFGIMAATRFSPDALSAAVTALRGGRSLYVDANMIRSGLSLDRLQSVNKGYDRNRIVCHIADPEVAKEAAASGLPRSLFAIRKASAMLDGGIAVFGNAPVALLELNRMIMEEHIRPALVIAVPVGFVHVIESKEELLALDVPCITLTGRRGGSPLAVSILHALCTLAAARENGDEKTEA